MHPIPSLRCLLIAICKMVIVSLGIIVGARCYAQPYTFIQYGQEHGFAATMAYCLYQDEKGYIWIGTEKGLMRFNGYEFKAYTVHDGLPDNEILAIKKDKKDRLWLLPYASSICYMKNGKIFNQENDPLLKRLKFTLRPCAIIADTFGNTWINDKESISGILADGSVKKTEGFGSTKDKPADFWIDSTGRLTVVTVTGACYRWTGSKFAEHGSIPFKPIFGCFFDASIFLRTDSLWYHNTKQDSRGYKIPEINYQIASWRLSDKDLAICSVRGIYFLDLNSRKITDSFLSGYKVGAVLRAKDNSLWFGTTRGFFRAIRTPVKSVETTRSPLPVTFIKAQKDGLFGVTATAKFFDIKQGKQNTYKVTETVINKQNPYSYGVFVTQNRTGSWLTFSSAMIQLHRRIDGSNIKSYFQICKSVFREDASHLLIASEHGICRLDVNAFQIKDTVRVKGARVISKRNDTTYVGTINGLVAYGPERHCYSVLPGSGLLRKSIVALCSGKNDLLWCANSKAEIIGLRNGKIVAVIDFKKGLKCNRIAFLKSSDRYLWVATDNGLFAIAQSGSYDIIWHFTHATGLNSDQVNCLDIYQNRIWIGTMNGVNYLDEEDVSRKRDSARFIINSIVNGDNILQAAPGVLTLQDKPLAIDFDVVDFFGGASPLFEYRLNGDARPINFEGKYLYFPTLPYGTFTLTIKASAPNWTGGVLFQQTFYNPLPFHKTWWFIFLLCIAGIGLLLMVTLFFVKKIRRRDRLRLNIQRNLLQLEQTALQGQMNPHFIFNCIAAVKQYYNAGDHAKANAFVDSFASLIRQTFEMGTEPFVPLDKELRYLTQYLDIEKARFNGSFNYHITKHTSLPDSAIFVPAMLLQPIVENAIRHGVRHLTGKQGELRISIHHQGEQVEIAIQDNGIGREKSRALRERMLMHELNSSMVNEKRIHILNRLFSGSVKMKINDLYDEGIASGTLVLISFPVNLNQFLKDERNNS